MPLHSEPAGHSAQLVRVALVPPEVKEPAGHTGQLSASFSLHMLSAPHSTQLPPLAGRYLPARQILHCVAPAVDALPGGHDVQFAAPCVGENVPAGHSV